jgi:hypothetical protein
MFMSSKYRTKRYPRRSNSRSSSICSGRADRCWSSSRLAVTPPVEVQNDVMAGRFSDAGFWFTLTGKTFFRENAERIVVFSATFRDAGRPKLWIVKKSAEGKLPACAGFVKDLAERKPVCSGVVGRGESYRPRRPEETVLYQVLAAHLETFLARQQQDGRHVPRFVERELRKFLECGIAAHGFLRLRCDACGREKLVPFSCKGRAFCPSCCGRRMADTAAHLVDRALPHVPVRQWVLSLPYPLRYRLAYDAGMVTAVLDVFIKAVWRESVRPPSRVGSQREHPSDLAHLP